jgi:hypothetical protein
MRPPTTRITPANAFTVMQWEALRARYRRDHDLWSPPELARLRFLRWLYRTGRLGIGHGTSPAGGSIAEEVAPQDG